MAAFVELPEFMNHRTVENFYRAVVQSSRSGYNDPSRRRNHERGMRAARDRNPHLLKFLEKAAEVLRVVNDAQQDRFEEGRIQTVRDPNGDVIERFHAQFPKQDFSEYATVRQAFVAADSGDPVLHVFAHIYAAACDQIMGGL